MIVEWFLPDARHCLSGVQKKPGGRDPDGCE